MFKFKSDYWGLILGGSSGYGLSTARKLAKHGMNIVIVHRDRRGAMQKINSAFNELKSTGVNVMTFNVNALKTSDRESVLDKIKQELGETGKIRMLLHSIAFGNLKSLAPAAQTESDKPTEARNRLSNELQVPKETFDQVIDQYFKDGEEHLYHLADSPDFRNIFLNQEDFTRTIHSMGFNIVEWVQDIRKSGLFAEDARVLGLTSEGNSVVWRGYAAVSAAKAVLESVSRSMAVEFVPYGIRSNVIQAGITDTNALKAIPSYYHLKANGRLRNPFGRLTQPEDIANFIFLLCMDEATWANGALFCVDGGERLGML